MSERVVVTGMDGLSPLGGDWGTVREALRTGGSGVDYRPEWEGYEGLDVRVAGALPEGAFNPDFPRRETRSMGRVALLATRTARLALDRAGLLDRDELSDGSTGVSHGSTMGSEEASHRFFHQMLDEHTVEGIKSVDFLKLMSHTVPANLCQFFEINGRMIPTTSACTSGSQGIGYGYESIQHGKVDRMVTGGAEELVVAAAGAFNIMFAASTRNDDPAGASRPFDRERDGLVVGEGAGTLVLERLASARDRGADIHAEVLGFGCSTNGEHATIPDAGSMASVLELALEEAGLGPEDIDYVNAHATATERGDIAESQALEEVFGSGIPVSSLKGHMGHTMGACGALEAIYAIRAMEEGWVPPTRNLEEVDERCGDVDYVRDGPRDLDGDILMTNNFAFGGVNTSLILHVGGPDPS